jgi:tRNA G10  N-methylase Trm11
MPEHQSALTYEGVLEMIRESSREFDRRMQESSVKFDRMSKETDRRMKETDKKISKLGYRIGEIIENMVEGSIVKKFQALGYDVGECSQNSHASGRIHGKGVARNC